MRVISRGSVVCFAVTVRTPDKQRAKMNAKGEVDKWVENLLDLSVEYG